MKLSKIVLAAAVFAATGHAFAGGGGFGGGHGGHEHAKLDTNGDGSIDRSEAAARPGLAKRFDMLDANHDGRIDASERPQHHGQGGGGGFARLDANHDGSIDRTEAAARPHLLQRFDQLDANHDGRIDASERPQHHGMGGEGGKGERGERLARFDTDKDGRLSRAEVGDSRIAKHFDMIDANHDGFLTREELRAAMERHRAQRMQEGASPANGVGSGGTGHD